MRGTDSQLWHKWYDGAWHDWEPLGGVLTSAPTVSTWGPGRATDNALHHKWHGPEPNVTPASSGWSQWTDGAESLAGPPGAVSGAAERQDVFWTGADQNVRHTWAG